MAVEKIDSHFFFAPNTVDAPQNAPLKTSPLQSQIPPQPPDSQSEPNQAKTQPPNNQLQQGIISLSSPYHLLYNSYSTPIQLLPQWELVRSPPPRRGRRLTGWGFNPCAPAPHAIPSPAGAAGHITCHPYGVPFAFIRQSGVSASGLHPCLYACAPYGAMWAILLSWRPAGSRGSSGFWTWWPRFACRRGLLKKYFAMS